MTVAHRPTVRAEGDGFVSYCTPPCNFKGEHRETYRDAFADTRTHLKSLSTMNGNGRPKKIGAPKKWPRERIIAALQADAEKRGEPPKSPDWYKAVEAEHPSEHTVRAEFGSWRAALAAAGLAPSPSSESPLAPVSVELEPQAAPSVRETARLVTLGVLDALGEFLAGRGAA